MRSLSVGFWPKAIAQLDSFYSVQVAAYDPKRTIARLTHIRVLFSAYTLEPKLVLMDSQTFFGLSHNDWAFINSFAAWFAAIGTIGAVTVSLYLASRRQNARAKVHVGSRIMVQQGAKGEYPELLMFKIANSGDMPIRIDQIGWKVGLFKKRAAIQLIDETLSSKLPIELNHGQEALWFTPINRVDRPWINKFCEDLMMPNYRTSCFTLRAEFYSSIGQTFRVKPESNLIGKLRDECIRLSKNKN